MGGHFFKKKTKCKKICLPHNYVSLLLVFFLVLEHVFVFFISIKIHKFCWEFFFFSFFFCSFCQNTTEEFSQLNNSFDKCFFFFVFTDSEKSGRKIFVCLSACLRGDISLWMRYVVIKDST